MKIYQSVTELVGHTPLLWAKNYQSATGARSNLFAKLEYLNPTGSVKDRVAKEMIESAERSGKLQAGGTVIEPTSGNTGIGIAAIAVARGYRAINAVARPFPHICRSGAQERPDLLHLLQRKQEFASRVEDRTAFLHCDADLSSHHNFNIENKIIRNNVIT